jgi:hypothetical protein
MEFTPQKEILKLDGFKSMDKDVTQTRIKNGPLLPENIRCLIVGPSNCGKTQLLLNLITDPNGLSFKNLYVFSKTLFQPKYLVLHEIMRCLPKIGFFPFSNESDVTPPHEAKSQSLMIFDDVIAQKQTHMREYFCLGRHKNIDVFYLSQCYTKIAKHLLRENANLLVLFKQDELNLRHVYSDHVSPDLTFEDFKNACRNCWIKPYGYFVIDKECLPNTGRYRRGFSEFGYL